MRARIIGAALVACGLVSSSAVAQTAMPAYAGTPCAVTPGELSRWFVSNQITKNGTVEPADSTAFPPVENTKCDFYKWGAQMFLWLTSPIEGAFVFDGPSFFDVVSDGNGGLKYVLNDGTTKNSLAVRAEKSDQIEETGQAGGSGVLISQQNSLTYYGMSTNDVYANYLTLQKNGAFKEMPGDSLANNFPTTADQLHLIEVLSKKTFPDGNALAMELKTSWVDASTVSDRSKYVIIQADVPSYTRNDTPPTPTQPQVWSLDPDPVSMELALVGMHVVGTVNGHPEMVWATFEHINNAPDAPYYLQGPSGQNIRVPFNGVGNWVFRKSGGAEETSITELAHVWSSKDAKNNPDVKAKVGDIVSSTQAKIGPNEVVRLNPWGDLPGVVDSAENNTELVGLNRSILGPLFAVGDVRANYIQIGSIWSVEGQIPSSGTDPVLRGSLKIANATMETFHQFPDKNNNFVSDNCFTCHSGTAGEGITTSHIFSKLQPLP